VPGAKTALFWASQGQAAKDTGGSTATISRSVNGKPGSKGRRPRAEPGEGVEPVKVARKVPGRNKGWVKEVDTGREFSSPDRAVKFTGRSRKSIRSRVSSQKNSIRINAVTPCYLFFGQR